MNNKIIQETSYSEAAELLRKGYILAAPTETCFIFAGNGLKNDIISRVLVLKNRLRVPMGLLVKNISMTEKLADVNEKQKVLLSHFWPGPVSFVLTKKKIIPHNLTAGYETVSVRVSPHPFWKNIFELIDFPIIATSANVSQFPESYSSKDILEQDFFKKDEFFAVVKEKKYEWSQPSTVVSFLSNTINLVRPGPLSFEIIESVWNQVSMSEK